MEEIQLNLCECCALVVANGDDTTCREGHERPSNRFVSECSCRSGHHSIKG